jgi:histidine triad (HIT) family protein
VDECVFCRIVAGDISAEEVASGEQTYAFRDINPVMPTHVLVVSRDHIESADTLGSEHAETLAEMFATAQKVARQEGVAEAGYRLVLNVGDDALNSVPHLHMHLLAGRRMGWPPG